MSNPPTIKDAAASGSVPSSGAICHLIGAAAEMGQRIEMVPPGRLVPINGTHGPTRQNSWTRLPAASTATDLSTRC
jgi:hypothetical protein